MRRSLLRKANLHIIRHHATLNFPTTGADADKKLRQSIDRQFSEPGTSVDSSDSGFHFAKGRPRTKSG